MPETNDPQPDDHKPDAPKPDAPKPEAGRADSGLARAYDRIKSAEQDLARLDRLVSGMERGSEGPRASRASAGAEAVETPKDKAPEDKTPKAAAPPPTSTIRTQGLKADRPMLRALVGLVLAIGILGAAFASQYSDQARSMSRSIMARWAPPSATEPPQAAAVETPAQPAAVQLAAADEPGTVAAPPVGKDTEGNAGFDASRPDAPRPDAPRPDASRPDASRPDASRTGATAPAPSSSDLAQSLKTITSELASMNGKLEQLKSRNEQTLREQADTIQQLKAAQEKDAAANARLAAQVQALQKELTTSSASSSAPASAKPAARSVMNNDAATPPRPHAQAAAPRRPRPSRGPWMPPPYMVDPYYGDPDW
ncbi:outer membrane murein-binding lipoprotein Lpp [Bradyrhizobium sp. F1.13.1]